MHIRFKMFQVCVGVLEVTICLGCELFAPSSLAADVCRPPSL